MYVQIKLDDRQHEALSQAAYQLGLNLTAYVRSIVVQKAREMGVEVTPKPQVRRTRSKLVA